MKHAKRPTRRFHGDINRPVFPNGSYLYGRLASPEVRVHLSSQQTFAVSKARFAEKRMRAAA